MCHGKIANIEGDTAHKPTTDPDAKNCTDNKVNRYPDEMASCKGFFDAAIHMSARTHIICKTARLIHSLIDQGITHCDHAIDEAQNSKEKGKAKFKKRELTALSREPKISPPVCNISTKH
jgi:hypothetical protein